MTQDQSITVLPAVHVASWQKKSWPVRASAGSTSVLPTPPPQSPPDLHNNTCPSEQV